jgi:NACalpha-BTF3-like transcription factor
MLNEVEVTSLMRTAHCTRTQAVQALQNKNNVFNSALVALLYPRDIHSTEQTSGNCSRPEAPRSNDQWTTSSDSIYFGPKFARSHPLPHVNATVPSVPRTLNVLTKPVADLHTATQTLDCTVENNDSDLMIFESTDSIPTRYEERGLDPNSISSVMNQVNCTRAQAVKALRNNDNDLFLTIMELTTPTTKQAEGREEKEDKDILPQSTMNSQVWGDYNDGVYERGPFTDEDEERTAPLIGKYQDGEKATSTTASTLMKANPSSFADDGKKSRNSDFFETFRPGFLCPAKKLDLSLNDKRVERKVDTIELSFETPGKALISGTYSVKGADNFSALVQSEEKFQLTTTMKDVKRAEEGKINNAEMKTTTIEISVQSPPFSAEKSSSSKATGSSEIDETGLDARNIALVAHVAGCTRAQAAKALRNNGNIDLINAIMELSHS